MPVKKNKYSSLKEPSRKKIILFKGISIILVPLIILCLIEFGLRLFHYGNNLHLFVEYKDNADYLVFNPDASKKYFTDADIATTGNSEIFKKKKDSNTIRLFVLGESTTIGYPYFHNGSFHRWLQYRLAHDYPDKNFEIINLSLTAVNSYTVLGFAKEVVNYEPDAILIYTGHNEFYGALGAASTQNMGSSRFMVNLILSLRKFKIVQLMSNVFEKTTLNASVTKPGESRMQLMAAKEQIPYRSDLYEKGVDQFKTNMDAVFSLFSQHHIPVFVSNLVSNDKDLKPFISFDTSGKKNTGFNENYQSGLKAFNAKDFNTAINFFNAANKGYNESANCNYYLAQSYFSEGNFSQAKIFFAKASDLDGLRFRAPQEFNAILSQLSRNYADVHLVDTKAAFESFSDHQIIGDKLIVDHVHPNLKGYAIMSDVFYTAINKAHILPVAGADELSFNKLLKDMPVTKPDSLAGLYRILNLKTHWPYDEPHAGDSIKAETEEQALAYNLVFKKAVWSDTMGELYTYYTNKNDYKQARNVLEGLALEYPADAGLAEKIAMLSGVLKNDTTTLFYFRRAFNISPSFERARYTFVLFLKLDEPEKALPYLDYAIANNSAGLNLEPVKAAAGDVIQLKKVYAADLTNIDLVNKIAATYLQMGNKDAALKYINKAEKLNNKDQNTQHLLAEIKAK
ncbi:GDSL-type esterase/lipase family protein [Mucilaginibacter sp. X5P1]|uniref:GDSL-type esterase/lipase family protein n=1 Tax=Mucilaginibacter sp. X5P1 TaxID=2723088 RepID=UPI00161A2129|nr:GDSL-type esterase/lipase family protein [Mucilaginibacter sp. X5P1]MBB6140373.1 TolA-binding protein [Mucilaginibacter sp. X5P1]